ncbi:MAG: hypothetical protein KDB03_11480 [Planctomycetales bacterium]|nr:hypothetical protein [Planctomycetales bacterium]
MVDPLSLAAQRYSLVVSLCNMQFSVQQAFLDAASRESLWVVLPHPDPLSLPWMGRAGYTPCSAQCPVPLADNPEFEYAGLATNPWLCPSAFLPTTLEHARRSWDNFLVAGELPSGFCQNASDETGLVRFCGSLLYAEIEIIKFVRSNLSAACLPTTRHEELALCKRFIQAVNQGLGNTVFRFDYQPLSIHGYETQNFSEVIWFGPGRRLERIPGAMNKPNGT